MKIAVIGAGCVGLTTALSLAHLGHGVTCVDSNESVVEGLSRGRLPLHEPGLADLLPRVRPLLRFAPGLGPEDTDTAVFFICVGTPSLPEGSADLASVDAVA